MMSELALVLAFQFIAGLRPDLSPGVARPDLTRERLCGVAWKPDDPGQVSNALWAQVLTRYGEGWAQRTAYQPARVIPGAFGGTLDLRNLAPLPKASEWNLTRKQLVEHKIYDEYCAGHLRNLAEVQHKSGLGWIMGWRTYFGQ